VSEEAPEVKEMHARLIVAGWVGQGIVNPLEVRSTATYAVDMAGTATAIIEIHAMIIVAGWVGQGIVNPLEMSSTASYAVDVAGTATAIGNKAAHLYDQWNTLSPFAKTTSDLYEKQNRHRRKTKLDFLNLPIAY